MNDQHEVFQFGELIPYQERLNEIPVLEPYSTRDGDTLSFRRYLAMSDVHVILLHGSSAHSAYLDPFAKHLSDLDIANVYALDLRGHGPNPKCRGDINYIGQIEDDIADLIAHIQLNVGESAKFIIAGHSSGGGMALRFAGSQYSSLVSGAFLLAPYFGHNAPMARKNAGGWAMPSIAKIIGISILNGFGVQRYNGMKVLKFNLPEKYHTGYETLQYSFRLMNGLHPLDYQASLSCMRAPLLIVVDSKDEALHATKFESNVLPYKADTEVSYIQGSSHLGIVLNDSAMAEVAAWIGELGG